MPNLQQPTNGSSTKTSNSNGKTKAKSRVKTKATSRVKVPACAIPDPETALSLLRADVDTQIENIRGLAEELDAQMRVAAAAYVFTQGNCGGDCTGRYQQEAANLADQFSTAMGKARASLDCISVELDELAAAIEGAPDDVS